MITEITVYSIRLIKLFSAQTAKTTINLNFDDVISKADGLNVYFTFGEVYSSKNDKANGRLYIKGHIKTNDTPEEATRIENEWQKRKTMPNEIID
jgi:hypothetical protein